MALVKIVSRWNYNTVLYSTTVSNDIPPARQVASALMDAVAKGRVLVGADLSYCDMSDMQFRGAKLPEALFTGSNLRYSQWEEAKLTDCVFRDVNASFVNFHAADLTRTEFMSTNLTRSYMVKAKLTNTQFISANLRDTRLEGTTFRTVKLGRRGAIAAALRSDGYSFQLIDCADGKWRVLAGCRWFTLPEAWKHWETARRNTDLGEETYDILVMFEHQAARADKKVVRVR